MSGFFPETLFGLMHRSFCSESNSQDFKVDRHLVETEGNPLTAQWVILHEARLAV